MFTFLVSALSAVIISALCSLMEAVLYSFPEGVLENLRQRGFKRKARALEKFRRQPDGPITAILMLNTIANTLGASIAGAAFVDVFGAKFLPFFAVGFTVVIFLFSEIIPKTLGVTKSRSLAPLIITPLSALVWLFKPIIRLTSILSKKAKSNEPVATEEDLKAMVKITREAGEIDGNEALVIRNVLAFDKKLVRDVMTPRTVVVGFSDNKTVGGVVENHRLIHSRIPVYRGTNKDDVLGIVYRQDLMDEMVAGRKSVKLFDIVKPVEFIDEDLSLDKLLLLFLKTRVHLFVVHDPYGGVSGIVTLEDVVEEILGKEIMDETDKIEDMRAYAKQKHKRKKKNSVAI